MNGGGGSTLGVPLAPAYSTTIPMPWSRSSPTSPRIQMPGRFISTIAEMRSAVPSHSTGTSVRCRDRIAVQRQDLEGVARERKAANLGRAAVDDVKQHALAGLHANRIAVAEHPAVDREGAVADFVPVGHAPCERGAALPLRPWPRAPDRARPGRESPSACRRRG